MITFQLPTFFRKAAPVMQVEEAAVPQLPDLRTVGTMPLADGNGGCMMRRHVVVMVDGVARIGLVLGVRVDFWTGRRDWVKVGFMDSDSCPAISFFSPREVVLLAPSAQQ